MKESIESQPLVTVIIPTYNRAHLIGETLDSILKQTYSNWECIVVDDGSDDNTETLLKTYINKDNRIAYYRRPKSRPKGANACRNYGFELSKGKYVNWFDDDDLMHKEKFENQVVALESSDYQFSVCQTLMFKESKADSIGLRHKKIYSDDSLYDFITQEIVFLTQAPFFRKAFLMQNGLVFDEELQAAQEWEFISRVLFYAPQYQVCNAPLVFIRKHRENISQGTSYQKRKWHYFLARKKVYKFLKEQKTYLRKEKTELFLEDYLKTYFRELLFSGQNKKIDEVYKDVVKPMYGYFGRIKVLSFINFVKLTGKGYSYRAKIIN